MNVCACVWKSILQIFCSSSSYDKYEKLNKRTNEKKTFIRNNFFFLLVAPCVLFVCCCWSMNFENDETFVFFVYFFTINKTPWWWWWWWQMKKQNKKNFARVYVRQKWWLSTYKRDQWNNNDFMTFSHKLLWVNDHHVNDRWPLLYISYFIGVNSKNNDMKKIHYQNSKKSQL